MDVASSLVVQGDTADHGAEVSDAVEMVRQLRQDFKQRDELYKYVDDVLYGRVPIRIPKGYRKIGRARRNPLAIYFTNTITAALSVNPPTTQFPATGLGDTAQQNATLREHFFDASRKRQEQEAGVRTHRRFTHSMVTKGEGVFKCVPRSQTAWGEYAKVSRKLLDRMDAGDLAKLDGDSKRRLFDAKTEEYKRTIAPYPIRSTDVQSDQFYYWKGDDGPTLHVEHKRVPYLESLVKYGAGLDSAGKVVPLGMGQSLPPEEWSRAMGGFSTLVMTEVWTWDKCLYLLTGPGQSDSSDSTQRATMVRRFKHRYGNPYTKTLRGPYAHGLGIPTSSRLPEHAGLGVLYGFLDLFVMLDELLTIQQINAVITGLATWKRNTPLNNAGMAEPSIGEDGLPKARQVDSLEPGTVFPYDIGPVEMPKAGQSLPDMIAMAREFVELILPKVLQGVVDTTDSGYQLALAARLGRIAFDPIVDGIRSAEAQRVAQESWIIENEIGERVYAVGEPVAKGKSGKASKSGVLSIGPDDLNGVHTYQIHLNAESEADNLVQIRAHGESVQNKFETRADAITALGGSPEEVERGLLLEDMKADPDVKAMWKQRFMQKLGQAQQKALASGDAALGQPTPEPGAALGGMGDVHEGGQNMALPAPGANGQAMAPQPPGNPAGAPGGQPPVAQSVQPLEGQAA